MSCAHIPFCQLRPKPFTMNFFLDTSEKIGSMSKCTKAKKVEQNGLICMRDKINMNEHKFQIHLTDSELLNMT